MHMSIEINKPAPLKIGNTYHYTLSSYEPVSITVVVPSVTDADVEFGLAGIASDKGAKLADVNDAWVKENLGAPSVAEVREALRRQLEQMNAQYAEDSKPGLCATELSKRLNQAVPADEIARYAAQLEQSMAFDAMSQGVQLDEYLAQMGVMRSQFDEMLTARGKEGAEQQAALAAYAAEKKLKVDDSEIPALLGMSVADGQKVIEDAKKAGQLGDLRRDCLNMKAANVAATECSCNYVHETQEDADLRAEQYQAVLAMMDAQAEAVAQAEDGKEDKGFKLV
jgi:FKBP-type peptidyl-prolyl cis-trans isomerase (trigger factor)